MHVILTHEQADFDAIASQLGASLLNGDAVPVLPQKLNRNVRAFLTIYGAELPFVERRDLPRDSLDTITLVDTQSMVSLKGMHDGTQVHVIDHHDLRSDLPPDWRIVVQPTGATTTLLVEALRDSSALISPLHATLLLLGIYEDTGSLTYTRTTARDLNAAAYLLEAGASLQLAASYLNHPLSLAQQAFYDQLRQDAITRQINGHTILIAMGDAQALTEELSSIAHKLRDLLEPDGLFLLLRIRGGVQMIARSTTDYINVSEIAGVFGGGGHTRAAAAMIKREDLNAIHDELLEMLPKYIRPAITVRQMMSPGPQLLTPDTSVQEAATRMQRYGYEGYPVVKDGQLVGLLTRRAVDRATSHKLTVPISTLMNAGDVTVSPDDSLETLQQRMTDSGWGQIPVADPATGQIIGIVTRTDLLNTLAPAPTLPGYQNLSARLNSALPKLHLALLHIAAQAAASQNKALYIVGGFVRDLILERPSLDFDLVVEGDAITLAHALAESYGGRVTQHSQFGTAKWILEVHKDLVAEEILKAGSPLLHSGAEGNGHGELPSYIDLITARTEFYTHPTALPTIEHGSIKLDLHRRDFTINTLALRLDSRHYGELYDYWGGLADLQSGIIRVLHSISFVDDPTRMLRAVRFEQRFNFRISDRTLELMRSALWQPGPGEGQSLLDRVSGDRIRHELDHILEEHNAVRMIDRLADLGILRGIHPAVLWNEETRSRFESFKGSSPEPVWGFKEDIKGFPIGLALAYTLWFLDLKPGHALSVADRLKLPVSVRDAILDAISLKAKIAMLSEMPASRLVEDLDSLDVFAIYVIYLSVGEEDVRRLLFRYVEEWRHIRPGIDGHALRKTGLPPGKVYKLILKTLRAAWLDEEVQTPEEEADLFDVLVKKYRDQ